MDNESRKMYEMVCKERFDEHRDDMREGFGAIHSRLDKFDAAIFGNGGVGMKQEVHDNTKWRQGVQEWSKKLLVPVIIAIVLAVGGAVAAAVIPHL